MRKVLFVSVVLLALAGVIAWAGDGEQVAGRSPLQSEKSASDSPAEGNLAAEHDVNDPAYRADCLSCHSDVLTEGSQDPRILAFHQEMMPFTPGYNPAHGPDNAVCVQCHRFVEIREDSAGALRKQVDPEMCALCHGPSGPGPAFYLR